MYFVVNLNLINVHETTGKLTLPPLLHPDNLHELFPLSPRLIQIGL